MVKPFQSKQDCLNVLLLGPDLAQMGGMATVENLVLAHMPTAAQLRHVSTHNYGSSAFRIRLYLRAVWQTIWTLSSQDVDVVHILLSQRGSALRKAILTLIAKAYGKPVILHAQSSEFHVFFDALPRLQQQILRWIFQKCSYWIALSESWKTYYTTSLGLTSDQVVVLRNPVQLPSQVPDRSHHTTVTLLFLGRIGTRKGAFDLIRAYAALPAEQQQQSHLILAGDGDVDQARELVQHLDLTQQITILDWLNPDQRDRYLAEADVFVLPTNNEGLPLALLEAMGWGLAVVTTPVGGIPEVVTPFQEGILVQPGNIQQLSDALNTVIANKNQRLTMGRNARSRIQPLNIQDYCSTLIELYRSASGSDLYTDRSSVFATPNADQG